MRCHPNKIPVLQVKMRKNTFEVSIYILIVFSIFASVAHDEKKFDYWLDHVDDMTLLKINVLLVVLGMVILFRLKKIFMK